MERMVCTSESKSTCRRFDEEIMHTELRVVTGKRVDLVLALAVLYKLLRIATEADLGTDPLHGYSLHNGIHRAVVLI